MKIVINVPETWLEEGAVSQIVQSADSLGKLMTYTAGLAILKTYAKRGEDTFSISPEDCESNKKAKELFLGTIMNCTGLISFSKNKEMFNKMDEDKEDEEPQDSQDSDPIPPLSDYNNPDSYTSYPV